LSAVLHKTDKDKNRRILSALLISIAALVSVVQLIRADKRYGIIRYIRSQNTTSDFVDNYYIAPSKDNVRFPGKKRNLIFIYFESMETTYTDKAHGGDFGMMFYFVDDSDGRAIWKTRITDNFRDIASRDTKVPSNVTFKVE